jgi:hypothetical protein
VELKLIKNTLRAGRIAALRSLPASVRIVAHGNRFTYGQALMSFTGYADQGAWRAGTIWDGDDNVYEGPSARVWVDGKPVIANGQSPAR